MRVRPLNLRNLCYAGKRQASGECVRLSGGWGDHAEALPTCVGSAADWIDQMVVVAVGRKKTAVAAAGGECLIVELGNFVDLLGLLCVFNPNAPGALLGMWADGAGFAELNQHVLIACIFEDAADVISDEALRDAIERQLHVWLIKLNRAGIVVQMLPTSAGECCAERCFAWPCGGMGRLLKVLRVGLPQRLYGGVEQTLAQLIRLSCCVEQCLPLGRGGIESASSVELAQFGVWLVETKQ